MRDLLITGEGRDARSLVMVLRATVAMSVALLGCVATDRLVGELPVARAPDASADAAFDGGSGGDPFASAGFCDAPAAGARCRGALVATAFRYALCTCVEPAVSGALRTDSFESARGPYRAPGRLGASVGVNERVAATGTFDVGGALLVGGAAGVTALGTLRVRAALRSNGGLSGSADAEFEDASFIGDVEARSLRVRGTLTLPAGRTTRVSGVREVARTRDGVLRITPPCDCDAALRVPVTALVVAHRNDHDDARAGITPASLVQPERPERVTLPCGRYYFDGIAGNRALTLTATGRVAIFVNGGVAPNGDLRVELAPGAEVDLFVTGDVALGRAFSFGDANAPARARMYVASSGSMALAGNGTFAGNLHAPGVELQLSGNTVIYGSVLARRVLASGDVTVHYDQSVLDPGGGCETPTATACASCRDCPLRACVNGRCAACQGDSDCCAPLRCAAGRCVPEPP